MSEVRQTLNMFGRLDIITGPMYSGKTTELLRRLVIEKEMSNRVLYVNNKLDNRSSSFFSSHNPIYQNKDFDIHHSCVSQLREVDVSSVDVIGVDEAQFFDDLKENVLDWVENQSKIVILCGLTNDFERKKFGQLLDLEPFSDTFTKLSSFCTFCAKNKKRENALFTHKIGGNFSQTREVGWTDKYIPLCRVCFLREVKERSER